MKKVGVIVTFGSRDLRSGGAIFVRRDVSKSGSIVSHDVLAGMC